MTAEAGFIDEAYQFYSDTLKELCALDAEIMRLSEQKKCGLSVSDKHFAYAALLFKNAREHFLKIKEYLKLPGEDKFLREDTAFKDFTCKGGILYGKCDKETVYENTENFIKGFPKKFDVYKYEISVFMRALSDKDFVPYDTLFPFYGDEETKKAA